MRTTDPIVTVGVKLVDKPLPRDLHLGPFVVTERTYAVVRIETAAGLVGYSYSQTRGAPVAEIIERLLAPALIGEDSASIKARWHQCYGSTSGTGRVGLVMRAVSLIDIALWDIQARRAELPLYQLLGGMRSKVPTMLVAGYPDNIDDVEETVEAVCRGSKQGFKLIKIARSANPAVTARVLNDAAQKVSEDVRFVVDGSWAFSLAQGPLSEIELWPRDRVAWLEDPFPAEQADKYRRLTQRSPVPIAAGDEVTDPEALVRLVEYGQVNVLRLDVATIGGVTAAVALLNRLEPTGVAISTHIAPELSVHLAGAFPSIIAIETFDVTGNRFDPAHELFEGGPAFVEGHAVLTDSPGLGLSPAF